MASILPVPSESQAPRAQVDLVEPVTRIPVVKGGRIPALDGLRGLAILLVLLWHGGFQFESQHKVLAAVLKFGKLSWSGVDLFFVLSGFLIGGILLDAKNSTHYFRTFYMRRAYRILPIYGFVIAAFAIGRYLVAVRVPHFADFWQGNIPWLAYAAFLQNFWMGLQGSFGAVAMVVTWSLAVEEQFYLTAPIIVRKLNPSQLAKALCLVVVLAPILRTLLFLNLKHGSFAAFVLMPCRADGLSLGVLCALLMRNMRLRNILMAKRVTLWAIASVLLLALAWLSYQGYDELSRPMVMFGYSLLAFFYACCLLIALIANGWVRRVLCTSWLRGLGGVAYCTYLLHLALMEMCARLLGWTSGPKIAAGRFLGGILTLVVARISWRFFEEPMLRRGHAYKY